MNQEKNSYSLESLMKDKSFYISKLSGECGTFLLTKLEDGELEITIDDPMSGDCAAFTIPPTEEGKSEVNRIICALQKWSEELIMNDSNKIQNFLDKQKSNKELSNVMSKNIKSTIEKELDPFSLSQLLNNKSESNHNGYFDPPKILYDCIPWGMSPMYDTGDTKIEDYEVFYNGQWVPGNNFAPKDILILRWNVSNNPEDLRKMCQDAIKLKTTNNYSCYRKILIGFQSNEQEYRTIIIFNRDPTWGENFTSSTVPDWLK